MCDANALRLCARVKRYRGRAAGVYSVAVYQLVQANLSVPLRVHHVELLDDTVEIDLVHQIPLLPGHSAQRKSKRSNSLAHAKLWFERIAGIPRASWSHR